MEIEKECKSLFRTYINKAGEEKKYYYNGTKYVNAFIKKHNLKEKQTCEICGNTFMKVSIHKHIKQGIHINSEKTINEILMNFANDE